MRILTCIALCGLLFAQDAFAQAGQPVLAGITANGQRLRIDPATGVAQGLGPTPGVTTTLTTPTNSLTADPSTGTLYTASGNRLYTLDADSGAVRSSVSIGIRDVRGLAFSSPRQLFAITEFLPDALWSIDPTTGAARLIGLTGLVGLQSIAVNPFNGLLYGYDLGGPLIQGLVTIDVTTGIATAVNPGRNFQLSPGQYIQGICFHPSGVLYGAGYQLFSLQINGLFETPIGPGGLPPLRGLCVWSQRFQVNQAAASLAIDGIVTDGYQPANVALRANTAFRFTLASTIQGGAPWELGLTAAPLAAARRGAVRLLNSDLINIRVDAPDLILLNQGFSPAVPPLSNWTGTLSSTQPLALSAQLAVANPASPGGISMSQGVELSITW